MYAVCMHITGVCMYNIDACVCVCDIFDWYNIEINNAKIKWLDE